jgi:hypothetical protein
MLFGGKESREQILQALSNDRRIFENVVAMANLGAAFAEICVFEQQVATLVLSAKVELQEKLDQKELSASEILLKRHHAIGFFTLGKLVNVIEKSGISGKEIRYLRRIVDLRNDFIHRLLAKVPLPGDWERYGYDVENFSGYTKYVMRHLNFATMSFPGIMIKYGLLKGKITDSGYFMAHPEDDFFDDFFSA